MATADQRTGVAEYGKARDAHDRAERALVESLANLGAARASLDEALARGDDGDADIARGRLRAGGSRREKAADARARAAADMEAARARALGSGAGFDLLSSRHPLLLLPVRLETRFAWVDAARKRSFTETAGAQRALLVRIYPDDIHDDPHEPELTEDELTLLRELDKRLKLARDWRDLDEAWADVIRRLGPLRAGWLGEVIARGVAPGRRAGKALSALGCPVAARQLAGGRRARGRDDRDPAVRSIPSGTARDGPVTTRRRLDGRLRCAALKAGMALVLEDLPDMEIRRLIVLGARGTLDPDETATELARLLDAQHYTRGIGFLPSGTPTNSLPGSRAGYSTRPELADVLPIERRRFLIGMRPTPLSQAGDDTDAARLALALGIDASTFGYVQGADSTNYLAERDLLALLATATRRRLVRQLDGILDQSQLDNVFDFGVSLVSPTGHLPILRVGSQPYGVVPVLVRDDAHTPPGFTGLLQVLDRLRGAWERAADEVPRVGDTTADPGEAVVRILQRDAVARRIAFRPLLGPELGERVANRLGGSGDSKLNVKPPGRPSTRSGPSTHCRRRFSRLCTWISLPRSPPRSSHRLKRPLRPCSIPPSI